MKDFEQMVSNESGFVSMFAMANRRRNTYSSQDTPYQEGSSYQRYSREIYEQDDSYNSSYQQDAPNRRKSSQAAHARSSYTSKPPRRSRGGRIIIVIALLLIIIAVVFSLITCNNSEETATENTEPLETTNTYDWNNLQWDGDRVAYYDGTTLRSELGVDVSSYQEYIDWEDVANDGISFASIRLGNRGYTEGSLSVDDYATYNLDAAKEAGLEIGAYFYSQAITEEEAVEEAELALQVLDGRSLDLPVVYDHERVPDAEGRANSITGDELAACTIAFCDRIEQAGYKTMIYGNPSDLARYIGVSFGNRQIWLAQYETYAPSVRFSFAIWQYTEDGYVAGIDTPVDMDIRFLDTPL